MSMFNRYNWQGGIISAYGPKLEVGIDAGPTDDFPGAIQSFKEEADINNIMRGIQRTGATDWLNNKAGTFEDVSGMEFQTAMDQILRAQEAFDALPSSVRDRFNNNPETFLNFFHAPGNQEELYRLGLAVRPVAPTDLPTPTAPNPS